MLVSIGFVYILFPYMPLYYHAHATWLLINMMLGNPLPHNVSCMLFDRIGFFLRINRNNDQLYHFYVYVS